MSSTSTVILCPGQGAQAVGMGKAWFESSAAARAVFTEADAILAPRLGAKLSELCFAGPIDRLNQTDVSQPAIYVCSLACFAALRESGEAWTKPGSGFSAAAGLSLGEYTALHLAGAFSFEDGLRLVAERGALMQQAAERSKGGMIALMGADETQAREVCEKTLASGAAGEVLVCANLNAPGQIVLSGSAEACTRAAAVASEMGFRATPLTVAGAFHSPLMQPAADAMADALAKVRFGPMAVEVWSNVTARPHEPTKDAAGVELLKRRLVEQILNPVRWSETCTTLAASVSQTPAGPSGRKLFHELAPGKVLSGLMRRIDRSCEVINHDSPAVPVSP